MTPPYKTYLNWSSGKDSSLALYHLLQNETYSVESLVTALNDKADRVSMHGLPKVLLNEQVKQIGLPLHIINIPGVVSMEQYGKIMEEHVNQLKLEGFSHAAFGDIFLEDLKAYREKQLARHDIKAVFPLWKKNTKVLMEEFIDLGFKAITISVNDRLLGKDFVGQLVDRSFLAELPDGVDPAGENGEYHTFVFDGPVFKDPVSFTVGEKVLKTYAAATPKGAEDNNSKKNETWDTSFWFCDLIPD